MVLGSVRVSVKAEAVDRDGHGVALRVRTAWRKTSHPDIIRRVRRAG